MSISGNFSGLSIISAARLVVKELIPITSYPTSDFNYVSCTVSGSVVTFRYEKDTVFLFNIVVTDPINTATWEFNTTP